MNCLLVVATIKTNMSQNTQRHIMNKTKRVAQSVFHAHRTKGVWRWTSGSSSAPSKSDAEWVELLSDIAGYSLAKRIVLAVSVLILEIVLAVSVSIDEIAMLYEGGAVGEMVPFSPSSIVDMLDVNASTNKVLCSRRKRYVAGAPSHKNKVRNDFRRPTGVI